MRELDQEILHVESAFRDAYGIDPFSPILLGTVLRDLASEIGEFQNNIRTLEQNLAAFEDIRNLKLWLKGCKLVRDRPDSDFAPF